MMVANKSMTDKEFAVWGHFTAEELYLLSTIGSNDKTVLIAGMKNWFWELVDETEVFLYELAQKLERTSQLDLYTLDLKSMTWEEAP